MQIKMITIFLLAILLGGCAAASTGAPLPQEDGTLSSQAPYQELSVQFHDPQQPESAEEPSTEPSVEPVFIVSPLPAEVQKRITGRSHTADSPVSLEDLSLATVTYLDFDGVARTGELIVHKSLAQEACDIFRELYEAAFPIAGVALIEEFDCDDNLSMAGNNTYCYCTRPIAGTDRFSVHSYGMAIDINPVQNPYILSGVALPEAGVDYLNRSHPRPGMILPGDAVYNAFVSRGWSWGGHWASPDYQHFEKVVAKIITG